MNGQIIREERHQYQSTVVYAIESESRAGLVHETEFWANAGGTFTSCTCEAGRYGRQCKHQRWVEEQQLSPKPVGAVARMRRQMSTMNSEQLNALLFG